MGVSIHAPTGGATSSALPPTRPSSRSFNPRAHGGRDTWQRASFSASAPFQSTRPRGARRITWTVSWRTRRFNPRAHGGRDVRSARVSSFGLFQSTRPRGARHGCLPRACRRRGFNPRAHGGRDLGPLPQVAQPPQFQSTRPRGARLRSDQRVARIAGVSIHAPTGGATFDLGVAVRDWSGVSIHAPTGGATSNRSGCEISRRFQSTRPRGARLDLDAALAADGRVSIHAPTGGATAGAATAILRWHVSIHAPTGGATQRIAQLVFAHDGFNPRAHGGRDGGEIACHGVIDAFQSTRPRGARLVGRDGLLGVGRVSIHAPTGGATPCLCQATP